VSGAVTDIDAIELIATPTSFGPGVADNISSFWSYTGNWTTYYGVGPYLNSNTYSTTIGDSAQILVSGGQQVKLTYAKGSNRGVTDVYIDGVKVASIDAYSATLEWQRTWSSDILTSGLHSVRLVHVSGTMTDIDAIEVIDTPSSLTPGIADNVSSLWTYTGRWTAYAGTGPYLNTSNYSTAIGDSAQILVSGGQGIRLTYVKGSNRGVIDVYIDGVNVGTINANSPTLSWQTTWDSPVISTGLHSVRFVHTSGSLIDIDAIEVLP
jgi:hypothetical protein